MNLFSTLPCQRKNFLKLFNMVLSWEKYIEKNPQKDMLKKIIFDISV